VHLTRRNWKHLYKQSRYDGISPLLCQPLRLVVFKVQIRLKEGTGRRSNLVRARMNLDLKRHLALIGASGFLVFESDGRAELRVADILERRREEELRRVAVVLLRLGL